MNSDLKPSSSSKPERPIVPNLVSSGRVSVVISWMTMAGCASDGASQSVFSPIAVFGVIGLTVANAIWFAAEVPWRRVILGNVLLLIVTALFLYLTTGTRMQEFRIWRSSSAAGAHSACSS